MSDIKRCDFCKTEKPLIQVIGNIVPGWSTISMNINTAESKEDDIANSYIGIAVDICPECYKEKSFPKLSRYEKPTDHIRDAIFDIVDEALAKQRGDY